MLTHGQIWAAVDALAKRYGYSPSGLARKAGLDATSFNKSKRISPEGRERWPSTESIAKILKATGADFDEFSRLVEPGASKRSAPVPFISLDNLKKQKSLNQEQLENNNILEEFDLLDFTGNDLLAVEVTDNSLTPYIYEDDVLIIAPLATTRKGDRILILTTDDRLMLCELKRRTTKTLEVKHLLSDSEDLVLNRSDIRWDARIMGLKQ